MTSYEIRTSNRIENTKTDCRYFPTRYQAEAAAAIIRDFFHATENEVSVIEADKPADITFEAWNELPW